MSDSVFEREQERLADLELQMGPEAGRLALALDRLTDALCLAGQHSVFCGRSRGAPRPSEDLQQVMAQLDDAKALVQAVLLELRRPR